LVDNRSLKSKSSGIYYRKRADNAQKSHKLAKFGTYVYGVPVDDDWLEVDKLFLPMRVEGVRVLLKLEGEDLPEQEIGLSPEEEVSNLPAWLVGETSGGLETKPAKPLRPAEIVQDHRMQRPAAFSGPGEWYEVVADRAVIRSEPSLTAHIENIKLSGEFVELFEWDEEKAWRRCKDSWRAGWMLLKHPQHGQILREVDERLLPQVQPMCEAIMTNDIRAFKIWLDQVSTKELKRLGLGALHMAVARGFLDLFVVLLEAGVNVDPLLDAGPNCPGFREPAATVALAKALSGRAFTLEEFDAALEKLQPEQRALAEHLFDEAAEELKAQRSGASLPAPRRGSREEEEEPTPRGLSKETSPQARARDPEAAPAGSATDAAEADDEADAPVSKTSTLAEVITRRVAVRTEPSVRAQILSEFRQGEKAELLEFDSTREWRRVKTKDTGEFGWTLIRHKTLGELWTDVGEKAEDAREDLDSWDVLFGVR